MYIRNIANSIYPLECSRILSSPCHRRGGACRQSSECVYLKGVFGTEDSESSTVSSVGVETVHERKERDCLKVYICFIHCSHIVR